MGNEIQLKRKVTKSSLKKYIQKVHSSKEAIILVTQENGYIEANKKAVELFEAKSREELLKHRPDTLSPTFQSHLGKNSQDIINETWKKVIESEEGAQDLILEFFSLKGNGFFARVIITPINLVGKMAAHAVFKKVNSPNSTEKRSFESLTDPESSFFHSRSDDELTDPYHERPEKPMNELQIESRSKSLLNTQIEKDNETQTDSLGYSRSQSFTFSQRQQGEKWTKEIFDKEIQKLDDELKKRKKEKAKLQKMKYKFLEKDLNDKNLENFQLKNEIIVLQKLLEEVRKSNQELELEKNEIEEKMEKCKKKKTVYRTEVERLTNRLKIVEFEKENLRKLM
ncbi:hypothetical protein M0811_10732 [Anaeramoeba ignava]|uniref:PAS domain-containing protein n=1 Tax=Anaeramoeba ignava TaxID=1746090 RepID=A0A9Q0R816_ANAIG|nr:hypothetical protein M0811_10732 [Anaeramoeba ignava]